MPTSAKAEIGDKMKKFYETLSAGLMIFYYVFQLVFWSIAAIIIFPLWIFSRLSSKPRAEKIPEHPGIWPCKKLTGLYRFRIIAHNRSCAPKVSMFIADCNNYVNKTREERIKVAQEYVNQEAFQLSLAEDLVRVL
jgi:hypothetical protein